MFCTSKERETCDVEKMTCEGCYYNKDGDYMNEEEIIEFIDQVNGVEREYKHKPIREKNVENIGMAIQSALNLYQKEKEKNKKLEEEKEAFVRGYSEAREDEANTFMNSYKQKQIYEKVIDMMAKYISNTETFPWENIDSEKVKQYYFKKARGEENVKDN